MFKLIQNGFIFDDPIPVPECHASTILKTGKLPSPQVVGSESEEEDASHAA